MNSDSTVPCGAGSRPTLGRIFELARGVFALLGFAVAVAIAVPETRDGLLNQFQLAAWRPVALSAVVSLADAAETGGAAAAPQALQISPAEVHSVGLAGGDDAHAMHAVAHDTHDEADGAAARAALTRYIANRYRVADEIVAGIVDAAYRAAQERKLDPLVVLAVAATESGYNPIAESVVGAKGLMQVIAKFHPEKLDGHGGEDALFDPATNVRVGAQILHEYLLRYGDLETALQMYAGAMDDPEARYARKVLAERERLKQALARSGRQA